MKWYTMDFNDADKRGGSYSLDLEHSPESLRILAAHGSNVLISFDRGNVIATITTPTRSISMVLCNTHVPTVMDKLYQRTPPGAEVEPQGHSDEYDALDEDVEYAETSLANGDSA